MDTASATPSTSNAKVSTRTSVSQPLLKRHQGDSFGAGVGFLDTAVLPRCHFKPLVPLSALKSPAWAAHLTQRTRARSGSLDLAGRDDKKFQKRMGGRYAVKAGNQRDKEDIAAVVWEAIKDTKYTEREREKNTVLSEQIAVVLGDLEEKVAKRQGNLKQEEADVDHIVSQLEKQRDLSQVIGCVDADAFYASVEELYNPSLRGQAFVVGEGIVLTASYEARKYGIRSAMASHVAQKLLPGVLVVKASHDKYTLKSKQIMTVLSRYGQIAQASVDEAYLNLTTLVAESDRPIEDIVLEIRETVKVETGLTVSCGVGPNKMLAKIAADTFKPDNQYVIPADRDGVMDFMANLPVRKVPGIGPTSEAWLTALSIQTCADIWTNRGLLGLLRCDLTGIMAAYLGIGDNTVSSGSRESQQSCSRGWTFQGTSDYGQLCVELEAMSEQLGEDLALARLSGRTVTLAIKYDSFEVDSRSFSSPTDYYRTAEEIYSIVKRLFDKELLVRRKKLKEGAAVKGSKPDGEPAIRHFSVGVSNVRDDSPIARARRGENGQELIKSVRCTLTLLV